MRWRLERSAERISPETSPRSDVVTENVTSGVSLRRKVRTCVSDTAGSPFCKACANQKKTGLLVYTRLDHAESE